VFSVQLQENREEIRVKGEVAGAMLIFVGMGLWDEKDMSCKGLEIARKADEVYIEFYTSKLMGTSLERVENFVGRKIVELSRSDLEENCGWIIERAKERNVVILVPGDPMIATTHSALRYEAERRGVKTRIVNAGSIVNAVCGLTGLHNYKFGKSATVSWMKSRTPIDVINQNLSINAHTLLFLDLHPKPMTVKDAVEILMDVESSVGDLFAVGIARAGSENPVVKCDRMKSLRDYDFGEPLHVMVVLAKLHFMEFECLRLFAQAPNELEEIVE
jgi:diphthine synthase